MSVGVWLPRLLVSMSLVVVGVGLGVFVLTGSEYYAFMFSLAVVAATYVSPLLYVLLSGSVRETVESTLVPGARLLEYYRAIVLMVAVSIAMAVVAVSGILSGSKILFVLGMGGSVVTSIGSVSVLLSIMTMRKIVEDEVPFIVLFLKSLSRIRINPTRIIEMFGESRVFVGFAREVRTARVYASSLGIGLLDALKMVVRSNPIRVYRDVVTSIIESIERVGGFAEITDVYRDIVVARFEAKIARKEKFVEVFGGVFAPMILIIPIMSLMVNIPFFLMTMILAVFSGALAVIGYASMPALAGTGLTRTMKILSSVSLIVPAATILYGVAAHVTPHMIAVATTIVMVPISIIYLNEKRSVASIEKDVKSVVERIVILLHQDVSIQTLVTREIHEKPTRGKTLLYLSFLYDNAWKQLLSTITTPLARIYSEFIIISGRIGATTRDLADAIKPLYVMETLIDKIRATASALTPYIVMTNMMGTIMVAMLSGMGYMFAEVQKEVPGQQKVVTMLNVANIYTPDQLGYMALVLDALTAVELAASRTRSLAGLPLLMTVFMAISIPLALAMENITTLMSKLSM